MTSIRVVIACISLLISNPLCAVVKGSETAVSIESNVLFPAVDNNNTIQGFAWLKNGFSLEDNTTTCTFNSMFPVSGTVDLNGGTLHLLNDLILQNILYLNGLGTIVGNNHALQIAESITQFPSNTEMFEDINLYLYNDLTITSTITFKGHCCICGNSKAITFSDEGAFIVDSDSSLTLCNVEVRNVRGEKIQCVDDSGTFILDNMRWVQTADTNFAKGNILFKDQVDIIGSSVFVYSSKLTSTIDSNARLNVCDGIHLCMGHHPETLNNPLSFTDKSSVLGLDNCSFIITSSGLEFTKGTLFLSREVNLDPMGTTTQTGIILGNGIADDDITVWFMPGTNVKHNNGYWVYNCGLPDQIKSSSNTAKMIRGLNSKIYIPKDLEIKNITVELSSPLIAPMEVESSVQLSYMNASVELPDMQLDITSDQLNAYTYCLNGNDSLFLGKGTLPMYLLIMGAGNTLQGNGGMAGAITLADTNAHLACGIQGYIDNAIVLNEGTFALSYDLLMRRNGLFVGPGTVNLGSNQIDFLSGQSVDSPIYWDGDKGTLLFNGKVTLTHTWTINGSCRIHGNDAKLVLGDGGNIVLEEGASLTIKGIPVFGLKDENIRCLDDAGTISLLKSELHLEDDFVFKKGKFNWFLHNCVSGAYTFSYDSNVMSTIKQDATLEIGDGATLALNKHNDVQPISFENKAATLKMVDATLQTSETGCQFTKGTIVLDGKVNLDMLGTTTQTGFITGNGLLEDDVAMHLLPGVEVSHNSGYWVYNNADPTQLKSSSKTSRLIRQLGSKLYMPQNLIVDSFTIELVSPLIAPIEVATGKLISYNNAHVRLPGIDFDITADQLNAYTYNLNGNDSLFITKGTMPLYLLVQNAGNMLLGNGGISGGITLYDSSASLLCDINGYIDNFITLNNGTFTLNNNAVFADDGLLIGPGTVDVGSNEIFLPPHAMNANTPIYWKGNGGGLKLINKVTLSSTWTINGKCVIRGTGAELILAEGAQIIINDGSELVLKNIRVDGLSQENIHCATDNGILTLINSDLVQKDDFRFNKGRMRILLKNSVSGAYTFSYDSVQTSTITNDGVLVIQNDLTFAIGRTQGVEPLYFEDKTGKLVLQDSTFHIKETGMQLTKGTIVSDRNVVVDIMGTTSETGLILGDGTTANDPQLLLNPGTTARFPSGYVTYDITNPLALRSKTKTASLIRGAGEFYLKQHLMLQDLTVDVDALSALTVYPGKTLSYSNGRIILDQGTFDLTGVRFNDYTTLLAGNQKIVLVNGSLPLATLVAGSGNKIDGFGNVTGPIILQDTNAELTCNFNGCLFSNIIMNGGKIIITNNMHLANNIYFSGDGAVDLTNDNINFGMAGLTWNGNIYWTGNDASIGLHAPLELVGTWTFKGDCEIKGNGQLLKLCDNGKIYVAPESRLSLHGLIIEAVRDNNIFCMGDDSVLILDDVQWMQGDHAFTFTKGALEIKSNVVMSGSKEFAYQSCMTSTIKSDSMLTLDNNFTFSYDPISAAPNLIEFEHKTSVLELNGAHLHITSTCGMQCTKGAMDVSGESHIYVQVEEKENEFGELYYRDGGITFGDGMSADNDFKLTIRIGSELCICTGSLVYDNVSLNSFYGENKLAILYLHSQSKLILNQHLDLGGSQLLIKQSATINKATGKDITGRILIEE